MTFTKGDCPVESFANADEPFSHCAQWRSEVFARLAILRPAVVIVSSYTREEFRFPATAYPRGVARHDRETAPADGSSVVWLEDTSSPIRQSTSLIAFPNIQPTSNNAASP